MRYQEQLTPWVVYQLSANLDRQIVTRFRRRNDADSYLKVLKQTRPNAEFIVAFDVKRNAAPSEEASAEKTLVEV
jgi:hypothetical protein